MISGLLILGTISIQ